MAGNGDNRNDVLVESGVVHASIRRRFEVLLCEVWSEIRVCSRPVPPMLGDGSDVDLYKLFMVVKGKGGFDVVCESKLWDSVAEESGLGLSVGSSVKLVYCKYLSALDAWLKKVADSKVSECGLVDDRDKFGKRLMELQDEVEGLLMDYAENNSDGGGDGGRKLCVKKGGVRKGGNRDVKMMDVKLNEYVFGEYRDDVMVGGGPEGVHGGIVSGKPVMLVDVSDVENSTTGAGEKSDGDDGGLVLDADGDSSSRKRKRECLSGMLDWVVKVAKNPCDPAVGSLPEKSKWKSFSNQEVWKQVLTLRKAVFFKKRFDSSIEELNWKNQRMHPFMYDDQTGGSYNLRERLRCDKRLLLAKGTAAARSSSGSSGGSRDLDRTPSPESADDAEKEKREAYEAGIYGCSEVEIPIGPGHQAEIPEWTGITSESDSKWLGTQIWPSRKANSRFLIERDPIGKGRQDCCGCPVPGSVDCVKFHIAEKKSKVKLELGEAFNLWNFDKIGEEVKFSWTKEEERRFKDVVEPNPPQVGYYFWEHLFRAFPRKSRADLVSYYFNVFLLQRRAHQNRHTPEDIDSDDDYVEDGLKTIFGQQTQKSCSILTPKKPARKRRYSK
ncbi:hypothetical protein RIF29_15475 [Crotalaria pallida]|uniref:ARID domain-containing protein n=1 Tax=Crotalaria pallida TaxID=3830 RepID=A0AAN9IEN8_CROPI